MLLLLATLLAPPGPLIAGCAEVLTDGTCTAEAGATLTVWSPASLALRWAGLWLPGDARPVAGGVRQTFRVPMSPTRLTVGGHALSIARPLDCPVVRRIARAQAKKQLDALDGAAPPGDPRCEALRAGRRARAWLRTGQHTRALDGLVASARLARTHGLHSTWRDDTLAAVFVATWRVHDLARARAFLADWTTPRTGEGAFRLPYYRAQIATEAGDLRAALGDLDMSAIWAERLGQARGLTQARQGLAVALRRIGRFAAADRILTERAESATTDRARVLVQRANNRLHWRMLDRDAPDPWPAVDAARAASEGDAEPLRSLSLTAARAALSEGDPARAKRLLGEADSGHLARWRALIDAELAATAGAPDADTRLAAVIAAEAPTSEIAWSAWIARARLAGAPAVALARYRQADRILRAQRVLVPAGEGRGALEATRRAGFEGALAALAASAQPTAALRNIRRAATGWLADFGGTRDAALTAEHAAALREWAQLSRDRRTAVGAALAQIDARRAAARQRAAALVDRALEASAPAPLVPPGAGQLFIGFARVGDRLLRVHATPDTAALSWLSDPAAPYVGLDASILAAREVWLFVDPALDQRDLHAAPVAGRPLALTRPVIYGLDLSGGETRRDGPTTIIRDPRGDLARARTLRWPDAQVLHQRAADRAAVRAALTRSRRLIYAGHSVTAGVDGWQSALLLAGADRLAVSDVLITRPVPAEVVLAACESGGTASDVTTAGVVQAFLGAGTIHAVGTTRTVADTLASALTDALATRADASLVAAWPAALADVAARAPSADWAAFRFWARVSDPSRSPGRAD